jgi:hypothetical protein
MKLDPTSAMWTYRYVSHMPDSSEVAIYLMRSLSNRLKIQLDEIRAVPMESVRGPVWNALLLKAGPEIVQRDKHGRKVSVVDLV